VDLLGGRTLRGRRNDCWYRCAGLALRRNVGSHAGWSSLSRGARWPGGFAVPRLHAAGLHCSGGSANHHQRPLRLPTLGFARLGTGRRLAGGLRTTRRGWSRLLRLASALLTVAPTLGPLVAVAASPGGNAQHHVAKGGPWTFRSETALVRALVLVTHARNSSKDVLPGVSPRPGGRTREGRGHCTSSGRGQRGRAGRCTRSGELQLSPARARSDLAAPRLPPSW
jgi:hypothetical protein